MNDELPKTMLNPAGGGVLTYTTPSYQTTINPELDAPKKDLRYTIDSWTLGRLETLAKSRVEISSFTQADLTKWQSREEEVYRGIAQSVRASSDIEGEVVYIPSVEIPPVPTTTREEELGLTDEEIAKRQIAGADIYDAYIVALQHDCPEVLTVGYLQELHRIMFHRASPDTAGVFKSESIAIRGGGYYVETVSWKRANHYLHTLTERLAQQWQLASRGRFSHFLLAGEYVLDFLAIHPFVDGNGRFARLISTYLLEKAGYHFPRFYSLEHVIRERRHDYYQVLFKSQCNWMTEKEDLTPWMCFYVECVELQYRRTMEHLWKKHLESQTALSK